MNLISKSINLNLYTKSTLKQHLSSIRLKNRREVANTSVTQTYKLLLLHIIIIKDEYKFILSKTHAKKTHFN